MGDKLNIKWLDEPEEHNYPAAVSYLSLIYAEATANDLVEKLRAAKISGFKAKDILRASSLTLLGINNAHVEKDRKKIEDGVALSPILLTRDTQNGKVIIADGYHRVCAIYSLAEDAVIPCKIV